MLKSNTFQKGDLVNSVEKEVVTPNKSNYAYIMSWNDYNAPAALYAMQSAGIVVTSAFKPFSNVSGNYGYGTVVIPVGRQLISSDSLYNTIKVVSDKWKMTFNTVESGYSKKGIDLGSGKPKSNKET